VGVELTDDAADPEPPQPHATSDKTTLPIKAAKPVFKNFIFPPNFLIASAR
jgi:hypothetical protein